MNGDARRAPVRLLWTGGWDSSFRLLQLLLVEHRRVQPIYVLTPARRSTVQELRTMRALRAGAVARSQDPALLAPTEVHIRTQYAPSAQLRALHEAIAAEAHIGWQYLNLAAVAQARGWHGVELGMEAYEDGPTALQRLVFQDDRGGLSDHPGSALFQYWSFPLLRTTKGQMARIAEDHGFLDLLLQRWFCHDPLLGQPCGACRPCRLANHDGVRFAPPSLARARLLQRSVRGRLRAAARAASTEIRRQRG